MPKHPILYREALLERTSTGALVRLDYNLVDTPSGGGLEPRSLVRIDGGLTADADRDDDSVNRYVELDKIAQGEIAEVHNFQNPLFW